MSHVDVVGVEEEVALVGVVVQEYEVEEVAEIVVPD